MNRARIVVAASLLSAAVCAGVASAAQQAAPAPATPSAQAPALKPVLAGRKFTPPLRGEAVVEFTQPVSDEGFGLVTAIRLPGGSELGLYEPKHPTPLTLA